MWLVLISFLKTEIPRIPIPFALTFSCHTFDILGLVPEPGQGCSAVLPQHLAMLGPVSAVLALAKSLQFAQNNDRNSHVELT